MTDEDLIRANIRKFTEIASDVQLSMFEAKLGGEKIHRFPAIDLGA